MFCAKCKIPIEINEGVYVQIYRFCSIKCMNSLCPLNALKRLFATS